MEEYLWWAKKVTYKFVFPVWSHQYKKEKKTEPINVKWLEEKAPFSNGLKGSFKIFSLFYKVNMRKNMSIMENINYLKREKNPVDYFTLQS